MASAARSSSLGQPGWLTNHWIVFPHICAKQYTRLLRTTVCFNTLGDERTTGCLVSFFILGSHLFFCILSAIQHVWECAAGEGRKRKRQRLAQMLESMSAESAAWWYIGARTELEDLEVGNNSLQGERALLRPTEEARGRWVETLQGKWKDQRETQSQMLKHVFYWDAPSVLGDSRCLDFAITSKILPLSGNLKA